MANTATANGKIVQIIGSVVDVDLDAWDRCFDINVTSMVLMSRFSIPHMRRRGGGSIINTSSIAGVLGAHPSIIYSATKGAVDTITRALSQELGPRKIRVNSLNPGMVETEGVHTAGFLETDFRKVVESQTPLGRIGQPGDIAPAAVFLASDDARWITGEVLYVGGGLR